MESPSNGVEHSYLKRTQAKNEAKRPCSTLGVSKRGEFKEARASCALVQGECKACFT